MNFQLVLVPGYNDGAELERSLRDLLTYENVLCIASVPVGLTKYRDGLTEIEPFNKETAGKVIDITEKIAAEALEKRGEKLIFAADEFYLKAEREIPSAEYYDDFHQLERIGQGGDFAQIEECTEEAEENRLSAYWFYTLLYRGLRGGLSLSA